MTDSYDLLVLGSGAAGLSVALRVLTARPDLKVAVLAKTSLTEGSTVYAQGGIAAVLDSAIDDEIGSDSVDSHIADTLDAGAGLCDLPAVRQVAEHANAAVEWLIAEGVDFDRDPSGNGLHLTREGGHSHRRIIHAADAT